MKWCCSNFVSIIWLFFLLVSGPRFLSAFPLAHFYPYGTSVGDSTLPRNDDGASPAISLSIPFNFFARNQTSLYVNNNGVISFDAPVTAYTPNSFPISGSFVLISPYWADVDTFPPMGGFVHYRQTADPVILNLARDHIRVVFSVNFQNFTPTFLFVATWDHVGYYRSHTDKTNTFQCVLTSDGTYSFVLFLYADDLIQWTTGDISGTNGLGGTPAQCGFNAGDGYRFFSIPGSQTAAILNVDRTSNVGVPGLWMFRVDQNEIAEPGPSNMHNASKYECLFGLDECSANAICTDTEENYTCACVSGFSGDGFNCTNVNECVEGTDNCHTNADCVDIAGSFQCSCSPGYSGDGVTTCDDIDECVEGTNDCHGNAKCYNVMGSFMCTCSPGYSGDGVENCTDIDECTLGTYICDMNEYCENNVGSYDCVCEDGYIDNDTFCINMIECIEGTDNCHTNADCVDTVGSFQCSCSPGYSGDGVDNCNDVDECSEGTFICDPNALCINTIGSYTCTCRFGYSGDGSTCTALPVPEPPVLLQVVSVNTTSATIMWSAPPFDPSNRIAFYNLTVAVSEDTFGLPDIEVMYSGWTFQYMFTGLEEYMNYTCDVISVGVFGTFSSPTSINFTTLEAVPSSAPQLSYGVAVSPIQLNITWLPPPVIDINGVIKHYNIEVTENITGQVTTYNVTDDHIIIGPVLPGNAYCCRVAAFTIGLGLFTDYFIVTSQEIEPSSPPLNIVATPTDSRSIALHWDPPLPRHRNGQIVRYLVNVTAIETGETFEINTTFTTLSLFLLTPFTTYEFVIAASTKVGPGPFSEVISVLTPEDVPSEPRLFVVSVISDSPRSLFISWLPPEMQNGIIIGYTVYCMEARELDMVMTSQIGMESGDSASGFTLESPILTVVVPSNETEITFPNLIPHTLYNCYASASTSAGEGNFTVQLAARTDDKSVCRKLVLEGGQITYSNNQSLSSVATYRCNDRLELTNSSQRTCMIDGQWSGIKSSCVCRELPGNVTFSDGQNIGSVASYQCAHASGLQQIQCRETSGWSGALCDCLNAPEGGVLTYSSDFVNNIATYQCNDGLQLTQLRLIRTCTHAGWDKEALPCVCEELSLPTSGTIQYSSNQSIGSTATYLNFQCTMGFEQSGELVRRCSENGWEGQIPHCRLTTLTAIAISVVATLVLIAAVSAVVFVLRKYNKKQRLPQDYYDVPYHYTLPPLPPRVHRMDSGIYDIISNNDMESETAFSTAPVNSNEHEQSKIENGDVLSTGVIDTTGTEIFQNNNMSESDSMQNPPASEGSGMQENKIGENRAMAANINVESNRVVNESIFGVGAFGLQGDQEREKQVDALPSISHAYTAHAEEESITRAEVHVQLQENASYQPSTNFDFTANLAYGTDIAIAPEIPTEANIAYQHTSSSQLSSSPDDNFSSATQRNDSLVSDED